MKKNIKSSELMIGDWVHLKDALLPPLYLKVHSIYPSYIQAEGELGQFRDDTLAPIPLTPEILEKNGFKKTSFNYNVPRGLCGEWCKDGLILVKMFKLTLMGIVFSVFGNSSRISNIRYVHELQHALKLCGIDKEIVL